MKSLKIRNTLASDLSCCSNVFSRRFSVFLKLSERLAVALIILFFLSFLTKRKATNASKAADSKTETINAMRRGDIGANSQMALAGRSSAQTENETEATSRRALSCYAMAGRLARRL